MSTDAKGADTGPYTLTNDEFLEGLGELEAYQARNTPPLPRASSAPPPLPVVRYKSEDIPEDMKGDTALALWPAIAVAFALSFGAVMWMSRSGPVLAPNTAAVAGNVIAATDQAANSALKPLQAGLGGAGAGKLVGVANAVTPPMTVQTSQAVRRETVLTIKARTEAAARVTVKAQVSGVVESVAVSKGAQVQKDEVLCSLQQAGRIAALEEARAILARAQEAFEASPQPAPGGKPSPAKVALNAAEARVRKTELELARTRIAAPFAGYVEDRPAKLGDTLTVGSVCAVVIAPDPLFVIGSVSERDVSRIKQGMNGTAKLATGETISGTIAFVARAADPTSRSFRVELQVPNADGRLRDGMTASLQIPVASDPAHMLSPSALTLNETGQLGVRVVEEGQSVRFIPVKVLGDERNRGVWVSGLPPKVQILVAGQDAPADARKAGGAEKSLAGR
jgi:multidrug efflux system membrane fusion protein